MLRRAVYTDADTYGNTYVYSAPSYTDANVYTAYSYAHGHSYTDTDTDSNADAYSYRNGYRNSP